jgi:hypothetical protein
LLRVFASVLCSRSTSSLGLDDLLHGNQRGPLPLRFVHFHALREFAQHCGHADILAEQILSEPVAGNPSPLPHGGS